MITGVGPAADTSDRIARLLADNPVFDGHNDVAWSVRRLTGADASTAGSDRYDLDRFDLAVPQPVLHTDIRRLRAGGVGAQFFSVYVPSTLSGPAAVTATLEQVDYVSRLVTRHPEVFRLAGTAAAVREAIRSGPIAALMGAEGGHSIDSSLALLRVLYRLGVRYLTLTHNHNTPWADAAVDVPGVGGLSDFGVEVVRELNRLGMLVDLSHVADTTMRAALDVTSAPVIFSHSSCRALCNHPRNVPDDVLGRLAENDGVVMITFVPQFVSMECAEHEALAVAEAARLGVQPMTSYSIALPHEDPAARAELARWHRVNRAPLATLGQVADHLDHAREVAGVAHVGLGGDFDGIDALPVGLEDVSCYPALLAELASRGWSDTDLAALTCGNMLRVLQAAEDVQLTGALMGFRYPPEPEVAGSPAGPFSAP